MKKTLLIIATFGLLIATSCSNEVRKEKSGDTTMMDTTAVDTTKTPDTTSMPPDTTKN